MKEAATRWDRATPSTHYDLVRARDEAQARMGISEANRAFLYTAEVDSDLLPIVMRMGRGDEATTARALKRDFNERYRDLGTVGVNCDRDASGLSPQIEARATLSRYLRLAVLFEGARWTRHNSQRCLW